MLVSIVLFSIFSVCFLELFYFPVFLLASFLLLLVSFPSYHSVPSIFSLVYFDSFSLILSFLTVFVLYTSYLFATHLNSITIDFTFYLMYIPCFIVFSCSNLLVLYSFYELSLVPIVYIIVNWGSYPERSLSALMLLFYTSLFSFPLIGGLFYLFSNTHSFIFILGLSSHSHSFILTLLVFLSFSVKLPIYGLHFWLPIAHVEAPTFGSIILAGILLKLGGVGLIRFLPFLEVSSLQSFFLGYSFIFLVFSSALCCFQSDFKRLVAYSSVSHMMAVPILVLASSVLSVQATLLLIVFHGLSSPILFSLVGTLYSLYSTRQLALIRGLLSLSPLLALASVVSFLFTLSAPPYPSFFSEVLFFLSSLTFGWFVLPFFLVFAFLSLVYNLNWLSCIVFSSPHQASPSFSISCLPVFVVFLYHLAALIFIFLIFLF